ncbi:MAG: hypothetical protein WCH04_21070, partial [Gammaproteobacteria bacterium]
ALRPQHQTLSTWLFPDVPIRQLNFDCRPTPGIENPANAGLLIDGQNYPLAYARLNSKPVASCSNKNGNLRVIVGSRRVFMDLALAVVR